MAASANGNIGAEEAAAARQAARGATVGRGGRRGRAGAALLGALLLGRLAAAWAQVPAAAAAPAAPTPSAYEFRPGVWFDAAQGRAYLMVTGGAVEAIDLGSGRELWRSDEIERPLWTDGARLLGQRLREPDRLSLVLLGVEGRPRERWEAEIELPRGVQASIDDGRSAILHVRACARDPQLGVAWQFDEVRRPSFDAPSETFGSTRETLGNWLVGLAGGALERSENLACPQRSAAAPPGMPEPGSTTPSGATVRYASADGEHYLASRLAPVAGPSGNPVYLWEIYAARSGERIAELREPEVGAWFVVRGPLLIHDVPVTAQLAEDGSGVLAGFGEPRLRAVSLASGAEVWSRAYRNTRYRGALPPSSSDPSKARSGEEEEDEEGEEDEDEDKG